MSQKEKAGRLAGRVQGGKSPPTIFFYKTNGSSSCLRERSCLSRAVQTNVHMYLHAHFRVQTFVAWFFHTACLFYHAPTISSRIPFLLFLPFFSLVIDILILVHWEEHFFSVFPDFCPIDIAS